jgi:hypothetical protein
MATLDTVTVTWDDQDRPLVTVRYRDSDALAPTAAVDADEWLRSLADRLTDKSAKCLSMLLELNGNDQPVSLGEVAEALGVERKEVDGWNRNFGRSVKSIVREHGFLRPEHEDGTAQVFDFHWDQPNNQWRYSVPAKFRSVLTEALD